MLVLGLSLKKPGGFPFYALRTQLPCKEAQIRPLDDERPPGERESPKREKWQWALRFLKGGKLSWMFQPQTSSRLHSVTRRPQQVPGGAELPAEPTSPIAL